MPRSPRQSGQPSPNCVSKKKPNCTAADKSQEAGTAAAQRQRPRDEPGPAPAFGRAAEAAHGDQKAGEGRRGENQQVKVPSREGHVVGVPARVPANSAPRCAAMPRGTQRER